MNVSRRSVQYAGRVTRDGIPELFTAVEQGEVAVSAAAEISGLPEKSQRRVMDKVKQGAKPARALNAEILGWVRQELDRCAS